MSFVSALRVWQEDSISSCCPRFGFCMRSSACSMWLHYVPMLRLADCKKLPEVMIDLKGVMVIEEDETETVTGSSPP